MSGLVRVTEEYKRGKQIRVQGEDLPRLSLGMMGDATRHIATQVDSEGTVWYRVEDIRDAAGEQWDTPVSKVADQAPVIKLKERSVFHYTTKAGAEYILAKAGTRQARAVQQLMD